LGIIQTINPKKIYNSRLIGKFIGFFIAVCGPFSQLADLIIYVFFILVLSYLVITNYVGPFSLLKKKQEYISLIKDKKIIKGIIIDTLKKNKLNYKIKNKNKKTTQIIINKSTIILKEKIFPSTVISFLHNKKNKEDKQIKNIIREIEIEIKKRNKNYKDGIIIFILGFSLMLITKIFFL
jgi:hypothetical protein